jgi:hypothetical protein
VRGCAVTVAPGPAASGSVLLSNSAAKHQAALASHVSGMHSTLLNTLHLACVRACARALGVPKPWTTSGPCMHAQREPQSL